ncbi:MAG: GNAT family N-acetyltransferase [Nitratireductor sp.]|nr:GNAT family N-acetyltransferase [Nitratireductor sp.]
MQTVIDIRMMAEADIPVVLEIQAVCYTELTPESGRSLHAKLEASRSTCLIASIEGATVGYLIALPWEFSSPPVLNAETCRLPAAPDCLYLHDLAVAPDARRYGTGRALVEALLARLGELGLGRASLVAVQNSAPYWERHGFRAVPLSEPLKAKLSTYGADAQYMERPA